jgi:hypothetical protein
MNRKEDIDKIISWCEQRKKETGRIHMVERNPFSREIPWTSRFVLIEIDKSRELAGKNSLVYDSTTKQLWEFMNGTWRKLDSDLKIE